MLVTVDRDILVSFVISTSFFEAGYTNDTSPYEFFEIEHESDFPFESIVSYANSYFKGMGLEYAITAEDVIDNMYGDYGTQAYEEFLDELEEA